MGGKLRGRKKHAEEEGREGGCRRGCRDWLLGCRVEARMKGKGSCTYAECPLVCLGRAYRGVRIIILGGIPLAIQWLGLGITGAWVPSPGRELVVSRSLGHNNNNGILKVI